MRKKLAIILISIHLVGNTEAGQLFKLPVLIQHYQFHHQGNPSIGFVDFLISHYSGDDERDGTSADNNQDKQLPCHNLHQSTVLIAFSPMVKAIPEYAFFLWETRTYISHFTSPIPDLPLPVIIQPPRLVS